MLPLQPLCANRSPLNCFSPHFSRERLCQPQCCRVTGPRLSRHPSGIPGKRLRLGLLSAGLLGFSRRSLGLAALGSAPRAAGHPGSPLGSEGSEGSEGSALVQAHLSLGSLHIAGQSEASWCCGHSVCVSPKPDPDGTSILHFQPPKPRKTFPLLMSHPVPGGGGQMATPDVKDVDA